MFWTWLFRVQAPGTEKSATFLPMKLSAVLTCSGPFSVTFTKVASGSLSPVWIVMVGILALEGLSVAPRSRSEEHTSELESLMRSSYAVLCLNTNKKHVCRLVLDNNEQRNKTSYSESRHI